MAAQTLFEKIWNDHVVREQPGEPALLYIDLHLIHEVTSPQAFEALRDSGRKVRELRRTFATLDHNIPTIDQLKPIADPDSRLQVEMMRKNCRDFGVTLFDLGSHEQGIVHVIGRNLVSSQPGLTILRDSRPDSRPPARRIGMAPAKSNTSSRAMPVAIEAEDS